MADTFRSLPTSTMPTTVGNYWTKVNQLGGTANYMRAYPQVFNPKYRWWQDARYRTPSSVQGVMGAWDMPYGMGRDVIGQLQGRIGDLNEIASQFQGPEATYIRWLIGNQVKNLQNQVNQEYVQRAARAGTKLGAIESAESAARGVPIGTVSVRGEEGVVPEGGYVKYWKPTTAYQEAMQPQKQFLSAVAGGEAPAAGESMAPPVPDWMVPYLEPSIQYTGGGTGQAATLRPIGAQAELSPTPLGQMAGYEAWGRAGAPTEFSEGALEAMSDIERWWQPYLTLSEKLFPKQTKLRANWMPSKQ